uniref:CCR4-NOT transcription complex subunit 11 n=1 Tax=Trichuris muris TaxID=70415 RepID=A0A5S6R4G7_TRIMR
MEDLTKLLGTNLGFSVAHFLSTHGERTFRGISEDFRCRFIPPVRVNVALGIAHILRRRPESTTSSARMIAIYVLYDAFLFHRPVWQHIFGTTFVLLLRNEPVSKPNGLKPLAEVERTFLLHLLEVTGEYIADRSPRELLTAPERMDRKIDAERYRELVISYAMRVMDIRPIAMYHDPAIYDLVHSLRSVRLPEQNPRSTSAEGDQQSSSACDDEAMAFFLLYHRVATFLFPFDESFFLPGSLVPSELFKQDKDMEKFVRHAEDGILLRRLPALSQAQDQSRFHTATTPQSSFSRPLVDWKYPSSSGSGRSDTAPKMVPCSTVVPSDRRPLPVAPSQPRVTASNSMAISHQSAPQPPKTMYSGPTSSVQVGHGWWNALPCQTCTPHFSTVASTPRNPLLYTSSIRAPLVAEAPKTSPSGCSVASSPLTTCTDESAKKPTAADWFQENIVNGNLGIPTVKKGTTNEHVWPPEYSEKTEESGSCESDTFSDISEDYLEALSEDFTKAFDSDGGSDPDAASPAPAKSSTNSMSSIVCEDRSLSDWDHDGRVVLPDWKPISGNTNGSVLPTPDIEAEGEPMDELIRKAMIVTLSMARQQRLLKLFEKRTDDGLVSIVNEDVFERLINLNPLLAVYIFCRLVSAGQAKRYFQRVLDMDLSLNVLDVVNRVTTAIYMPIDFLYDFLYKCYSHYAGKPSSNGSPHKRMITLIISFTESLFERRLIDVIGIRYEALHFCLLHINLSQAVGLYRQLKISEDD